jgi:hypothetical protein
MSFPDPFAQTPYPLPAADVAPAPATEPAAAPAAPAVPAVGAIVSRTYDDPYVPGGMTTRFGLVVAHSEDEGGPLVAVAWLPELSTAMRPDDLNHH